MVEPEYLLGTLSGCDLCRRAKENSLFPSILHKIVLKYRPLAPGAYSHPAKSDHLAGRFTAAATVISLRSKSLPQVPQSASPWLATGLQAPDRRTVAVWSVATLPPWRCARIARAPAQLAMITKTALRQAVPRRSHSLTAAVQGLGMSNFRGGETFLPAPSNPKGGQRRPTKVPTNRQLTSPAMLLPKDHARHIAVHASV